VEALSDYALLTSVWRLSVA